MSAEEIGIACEVGICGTREAYAMGVAWVGIVISAVQQRRSAQGVVQVSSRSQERRAGIASRCTGCSRAVLVVGICWAGDVLGAAF